MKTSLKNITTIATGIYTTSDAYGNVFYLQAKHFNEKGVIEILPKPEIWLNEKNGKHLLKNGDILFAAKGTKNFAAVFNTKIGNAVASSTFMILRINNEQINKILPEYLAWWLNNTECQRFLKNLAIGSALPSISKAALQELDIFIPDLKKQKMILKLLRMNLKLLKKESSPMLSVFIASRLLRNI